MAMLVPLSTGNISSSDIFRLAKIKSVQALKEIEERNRRMQATGPRQFYRQQTGPMKRLEMADKPTMLLAAPRRQKSGPLQQERSIYRQLDSALKDLIEGAVKKHLSRYGRPVLGVFVSHFNLLYLQLFDLDLNITVLENQSLDNNTVICLS